MRQDIGDLSYNYQRWKRRKVLHVHSKTSGESIENANEEHLEEGLKVNIPDKDYLI
jgi:hypothetical protein